VKQVTIEGGTFDELEDIYLDQGLISGKAEDCLYVKTTEGDYVIDTSTKQVVDRAFKRGIILMDNNSIPWDAGNLHDTFHSINMEDIYLDQGLISGKAEDCLYVKTTEGDYVIDTSTKVSS
jgi:predicted transcriptional regulator